MKKIIPFLSLLLILSSCNFNKSNKIDLIPYLDNGLYGYFDFDGKIVITPQFKQATVFRDGLALVQADGDENLWGFIDASGKYVIKPEYKDATVFSEEIAWVVSDNSAPKAINTKGEVLFTLKQANKVRYFSNSLAAFSVVNSDDNSEKWGFVDAQGNQKITAQFDMVGYFSENLCAVRNTSGKWGYIDNTGKIIINYQFDGALAFTDGNATVSLDGKYGIINNSGEYIINPQYKSIYKDGELYNINQDRKYGWVDKEGKYIINPQFDDALFFLSNDLCPVKISKDWGYVNKEGKIIINGQFQKAFPFIGDKAIVKSGDSYGVIDKEGKYIVNPQFKDIGDDLIMYLFQSIVPGSIKSEIETDYINLDGILSAVDFEKPENIGFDEGFNSILKKLNLSPDSFGYNDNENYLFRNKKINNEVQYSFAMEGNIKLMNDDTYEFYISKEKPLSFLYEFYLSGKAYGRAESIQKEFESKLDNYSLIKKGFISGRYISIYKGTKSIVMIGNYNSNEIFVKILPTNFQFDKMYLNSIVQDKNTSIENNENYDYSYGQEAPIEDAVVVDTAAVYTDY
jgi:hypothetical protein